MDADDLRSLSRVLVYGTAVTRRALARRLASDPASDMPGVLLSTVRSDEPKIVRDRCLEVLTIMAAAGNESASGVLEELGAPV
ncbi:MAG TPA: hypothetical protein VGB19_02645 [Actinomycetota bacterium]